MLLPTSYENNVTEKVSIYCMVTSEKECVWLLVNGASIIGLTKHMRENNGWSQSSFIWARLAEPMLWIRTKKAEVVKLMETLEPRTCLQKWKIWGPLSYRSQELLDMDPVTCPLTALFYHWERSPQPRGGKGFGGTCKGLILPANCYWCLFSCACIPGLKKEFQKQL